MNIANLIDDFKNEAELLQVFLQSNQLVIENVFITDVSRIKALFPTCSNHQKVCLALSILSFQAFEENWAIKLLLKFDYPPGEQGAYFVFVGGRNSQDEEIEIIPAELDQNKKLIQNIFDSHITTWLNQNGLQHLKLIR